MASRPKRRKPPPAGVTALRIVTPGGKSTGAPSTSATPGIKLRTISASEFAARFAHGVSEKQQSFTWLLGAGCSVSSGIPSAGGLAKKWLGELHQFQQSKIGVEDFETWLKREYPKYDPSNPGGFYAEAFEARHPFAAERQREIETICATGQPKFGYATLAELVSNEKYGRYCNTVLTTNFDDLIADALYLYGDLRARPLVVTHEALARYVRTNSPRPTVVKLHGDAHLDPKNLHPETNKINESVSKQLYLFLQDHALVFVGYGGNDASILDLFKNCPLPPLSHPIYWVSKREPPLPFGNWLWERGALRVDHADFDQLMHLIRGALDIKLLEKKRWDRIGSEYVQEFSRLTREIEVSTARSDDASALRSATDTAQKSLKDDWSFYFAAQRTEKSDPDLADSTYKKGLVQFPSSALLHGMYGAFLETMRGDMAAAETHYKRALDADPNMATNLGNYANFLNVVRKDLNAAEAYYRRSIAVDPSNPGALGNYAVFLSDVRKDMVAAETYYKRALDADPADADNLGNYAQVLLALGRQTEGLAMLDRATSARTGDKEPLGIELSIYRYAHDSMSRDRSLGEIKKRLTAGTRAPNCGFAVTLDRARQDGHPDLPLLEDLVKVANDEAKIEILEKHAAWRD
jgi:protein O-mannosyl-transferase